ncbi:hypothetical protein Q1695_009747 [Nippostrongylus brasiliensis]|nr:hypothetical protein Q1695_009747 [Nippostrongylus brasiliensis]
MNEVCRVRPNNARICGSMASKVELELRRGRPGRRGAIETAGNKTFKMELELKKNAGVHGQEGNQLFTESWKQYSDNERPAIVRSLNEGKELLQYRGKRTSTECCSDSSTSLSDESELISQLTESTTSDFFSASDQTSLDADQHSDRECSPPSGPFLFAPGLKSLHEVRFVRIVVADECYTIF